MTLNRSASTLALVGGLIFTGDAALAATLTVGPGQTYTTIQGAIDASVAGDVVEVMPGTYIENVSFKGKAVVLQSTTGPSGTTIRAAANGPTVRFAGGETSSTLLLGFTITGGTNSGISVIAGSSPVIRDCVVTGNFGENGGGINVFGGATLDGNLVSGNQATYGGGVYVNNSTATLTDNDIVGNSAASGGGLYLNIAATVTGGELRNNTASSYGGGLFSESAALSNVLITGNSGTYGGGVHADGALRLTNVTVASNLAQGTYGTGGGIFVSEAGTLTLRNVIVAGNRATTTGGVHSATSNPVMTFSDVAVNTPTDFGGAALSQAGTNGNISSDPKFASESDFPFALLNGSPCIDKGDSDRSLNDPDGSRSDMGYYGGPAADWAPYADSDSDGVDLANGDCDDLNGSNVPGGVELCDGADNNCDEIVDNGLNDDDDSDGQTECGGDCDDGNPSVFTGATDIPEDGIDQDCDGSDAEDNSGGCASRGARARVDALALALTGLLTGLIRRRRSA